MTIAERRYRIRRITDHEAPCRTLEEHLDLEKMVISELTVIKEHLAELPGIKIKLAEVGTMLTVFNNTKGFLEVTRWISISFLSIAAVVAAGAGAMAAFKAWVALVK